MPTLPTPDAAAGTRGGAGDPARRRVGGHSVGLEDIVIFLPTPMTLDHKEPGPSDYRRRTPGLRAIDAYLPTPRESEGTNGGPNQRGSSGDLTLSSIAPTMAHSVDWGKYTQAVERHEQTLGRPHPAPTSEGHRGGQRLSPAFTEWMMGWDEGYVTTVPGLTRAQQLSLCGDGVVPAQAVAALTHLLFTAPPTERHAAMGNTPAPPGTITAGKLTAGQTVDHDGLTRLVADVIDGADRYVTVVFAEPDPSEERARRIRVGKSSRFQLVDVPDNETVDSGDLEPFGTPVYNDDGTQVGIPAPEVQQQIADSVTARNMQNLYPKAATVGDPEASRAAVDAVLAAARAAKPQPPSEAVERALQRARDGELAITPDVAKAAAKEIINNGDPVEMVRSATDYPYEGDRTHEVAADATIDLANNTIGGDIDPTAREILNKTSPYYPSPGDINISDAAVSRTPYTYGDPFKPAPPHLRVTLHRPPVAGRMAIIDGGTVIPISPDDTPTIGEYADALIHAERTLSDDVAGWLFVGPWTLETHSSHTVTFTAQVQKASQ